MLRIWKTFLIVPIVPFYLTKEKTAINVATKWASPIYARETHRIHLYFGEFWLFCKCFLCVSIRDNALVKHTGSTYYKWFLVISCSNTWVRKAQDVLRFEKSCQKWRNFDYKHILCLSHSSVWTWNAQDPLPFFNDLGIFGYFCKNETHRMCLWTFFC